MQKIFNLIAMALFAVIGVKEFISNGFGNSVVICGIIVILLLLEYLFMKAKYTEGMNEQLKVASEALKGVSAPFGFLGNLTIILAAIFLFCTIVLTASHFITAIPTIITTIATYLNYIVITLLPYSLTVGILKGKYGKGLDFMVYTIGLMLYLGQGYFFNQNINVFIGSQILLAISMWNAISTAQMTSAPAPKTPKEKKPKVSKKDKKAVKEVAQAEADLTDNAKVLESVKNAAENKEDSE